MMNENPITVNVQQTMDREFGRLEARVESLEKRLVETELRVEKRIVSVEQRIAEHLSEIRKSQQEIQECQQEIIALFQQGKGARRMLGWLVAGAAGVGAFITWVLDVWNFGRGS